MIAYLTSVARYDNNKIYLYNDQKDHGHGVLPCNALNGSYEQTYLGMSDQSRMQYTVCYLVDF